MKEIKVSVIVPIYNVEKYIERCVRSLMGQTLEDIEYIFVNDCTPDKSIEILQKVIQDYPQRLKNIHILNNQTNRGVSYSKNQGINHACGEYLIFCDSDDWIEPDMYEKLYNHAISENADIACCEFWDDFVSEKVLRKESYYASTNENIKAMLQTRIHGSNCNKLVKKTLYSEHSIKFPNGINMWEDLYTSVRLFYYSQKITYIPQAFYHYFQQNSDSLVNNLSLKKIEERIEICNLIEKFFHTNNAMEDFTPALQQRKLWAKMEFAADKSLKDFNHWRELWLDANSQIVQSTFSTFNKLVFILVDKKLDSLASILLNLKYFIKRIYNN